MKIILSIVLTFCSTFYFSQNNLSESDLVRLSLLEHIRWEKKSNKSDIKEFNVILDNKQLLNSLKDIYYDDIKVHFLSERELKHLKKKGVNAYHIYFPVIENNTIHIIIMGSFFRKKRVEFFNKSIYYFKYDCKNLQFTLDNDVHQIW